MSNYKDVDNIIRIISRHEFMLESMIGTENYQLAIAYRKPMILELEKSKLSSYNKIFFK